MADKVKIPHVNSLDKELSEGKLRNLYFICGEDSHSINETLDKIEKVCDPLITSDFDKEKISGEKGQSLSEILDLAAAFPFGSEKKLIILKGFESLNDKKLLKEYIENQPNFTVLAISNYGTIKSFKSEPFSALIKSSFFFEARKLMGRELSGWLVKEAEKLGYELKPENAHAIIDFEASVS